MKKVYLISTIVLAITVIIFALLAKFFTENQIKSVPLQQKKQGIVIFLLKENEVVSSPLKIEGYVNGDGWIGFEAQVGTVKLLDSKGNELAFGVLQAKGEWMQQKIDFETTLNFISTKEQDGSLIFYNENPSGEPERNKTFTLPVKLPKMEPMQVSVFFGKYGKDECEKVSEVKRTIQKTTAPARTALEELLIGPYIKENTEYFTSINSGVKIQSLTIENGVAKVDFSAELNKNVAGSCRVMAIRSQIEKTLLQFSTVKSVVISVNGRTEDILQP
ncbi:MAG: GerMN domain-containing protein [Patescibacteria group bacterium]